MKDPRDYIVFPLDVPTYDQAMRYVELLSAEVGLFKVGLELFISQGPAVINAIHQTGGAGVFLDLKLHDIPATVKRAFAAASAFRPRYVTVHCDEGGDAIKAAIGENPGGTRLLAITVLTSLNQDKLRALGYAERYAGDIAALVLLKARLAKAAGCHGLVCSGLEVGRIREALGDELILVTPGIRPAWSIVPGDDQQRIVTPAMAVRSGADHVVIGRPIRDAPDPVEAARRVADEIGSAL